MLSLAGLPRFSGFLSFRYSGRKAEKPIRRRPGHCFLLSFPKDCPYDTLKRDDNQEVPHAR